MLNVVSDIFLYQIRIIRDSYKQIIETDNHNTNSINNINNKNIEKAWKTCFDVTQIFQT